MWKWEHHSIESKHQSNRSIFGELSIFVVFDLFFLRIDIDIDIHRRVFMLFYVRLRGHRTLTPLSPLHFNAATKIFL